MVATNFSKRTSHRKGQRFAVAASTRSVPTAVRAPCSVVAVAKRRDGGTRYWCSVHKADATAKYGKSAGKCRAADEPPLSANDILNINLDQYRGGVALWGAVPAVYDTTRFAMDRGIHVHARSESGKHKDIDHTSRAVRLSGSRLSKDGVLVNEIDAIYYMVTSVFGFLMSQVRCTHCDCPHLDKDFFSVHPHQRHLCAGCGRHFRDSKIGIGNPIMGIREVCGVGGHRTTAAKENLKIRQADFPGGIQVWGSNAAFIWTGEHSEADGIHIHAYRESRPEPEVDETYREVVIDGIPLDAKMVRVLMAQNVMPSLNGRVRSFDCPACKQQHFGVGEAAYTPSATHSCSHCGHIFAGTGRFRKTVVNPLPAILEKLVISAPRKPQHHRLDLRPETL